MLNRKEISARFFLCYPGKTRVELAALFAVRQPTVSEWAGKDGVPWSKLKYLSDSQAISWDWLMNGEEPKESGKRPAIPESASPLFDKEGINLRYLSLFPGMSQFHIAKLLGIHQTAVSAWKTNRCQVSWERLDDAVTRFHVRWDWLIDGLEPQYRDGK